MDVLIYNQLLTEACTWMISRVALPVVWNWKTCFLKLIFTNLFHFKTRNKQQAAFQQPKNSEKHKVTCKINRHQAGMIHMPPLGALVCSLGQNNVASRRSSERNVHRSSQPNRREGLLEIKGQIGLLLPWVEHPWQHKVGGISGTLLSTQVKSWKAMQ